MLLAFYINSQGSEETAFYPLKLQRVDLNKNGSMKKNFVNRIIPSLKYSEFFTLVEKFMLKIF